MAMREIDPIGAAITATEKEIAGAAWGDEDPVLDETGDRTIEQMGEGLEGQHELDDDDEAAEGDESEDEAESEEGDGDAKPAVKEPEGEAKPAAKAEAETEGRVPPGRLREQTERTKAAEAERDALKGKVAKQATEFTTLAEKLDLALRQIDDLRRAPRVEPGKTAEADKPAVPDFFEDPNGFIAHQNKPLADALGQLRNDLAAQRVETSMAMAHGKHGDAFAQAFEAVQKLNPQNSDDQATVRRIYASPNPGEALVGWHKRNETLRQVGDDPAAYAENIRKAEREALIKDPEFRKQLLADLRAEASGAEDGKPRTEFRLPKSLNGAAGGNRRDASVPTYDDNDSAIAAAAWRDQ